MNYYESVVIDYLRADRALFLNTECCLQLNEDKNPDHSGPHWYCDAVALDLWNKKVYLCEFSYSLHLSSLLKRISAWHEHWDGIRKGLIRDSHILPDWEVSLWLFVPLKCKSLLELKLEILLKDQKKFSFKVTALEDVQPWKYSSWDRIANPHAAVVIEDQISPTSLPANEKM